MITLRCAHLAEMRASHVVVALLITACACTAQLSNLTPPASAAATTPANMKIFEAATGLANTLTSWAFVMMGGSILTILGTSYYRPKALWIRCAYFAFVPAWFFLSSSVYAGTRVQSVYLAALYQSNPQLEKLKDALNRDALAQIDRMEIGLSFLGIWLIMYLLWWIFNNEAKEEIVI